ncbi:unnamed protein product [Lymnaea stagnalis]|uniref:ADP-ribosylation factor n=1 Tax=Lymnaea stagnalis TaxID=6523 RepID=A0AAV2I515_LYMST
MGGLFSRSKDVRVLIQGLDAAGKTSLLYKLKLGEVVTTIPTIGECFNVESIVWKAMSITAWDLGGRDKIRPLYRHYYPNTHGFIYILDSNDRERLGDAIDELFQQVLWDDALRDTVVMVLANKQDLPGAMSVQEIEEKLRQRYVKCSQTLFLMPCSVLTGEGIMEAFDAFVDQLKLRQSGVANSGFITITEQATTTTEQLSESYIQQSIKYFLKSPFSCMKFLLSQEKQLSLTDSSNADEKVIIGQTDDTQAISSPGNDQQITAS